MQTLKVRDLGHVNQITADYNGSVAHLRRFYDAHFFSPIWTPLWEATNSLFLIGNTCLEVMAPYGPNGMLGKSLQRSGPGYYGFEFRVFDYYDAKQAFLDRGVAISSDSEPDFFWPHPRDTHGILLAILPKDFDGDPRDEPTWDGFTRWAEHPLGITGLDSVSLLVQDADRAAEFFADLCAEDVVERGMLQRARARSASVVIADTTYTFLSPFGAGDVADQLNEKGPGVRSVNFAVKSIESVRDWSLETAMPVGPADEDGGLAVPAVLNLGCTYSFVQRG